MAGFQFGNVGDLNSRVTVQCFVFVVLFIMTFDAFIGVLEYFLEESRLYHRILQTIYKELMMMGILSFSISMILALESPEVTHSEEGTKWIQGIEFSHVLLFFLTFFFVGHSLFILRKSIVCRTFYRQVYQQKVTDVLREFTTAASNPFRNMLFRLNYLPATGVKEKMELWLIYHLFRDCYWLPRDFNFADYLGGCFDQYAQKTTDRSYTTWIFLMVLAVLNFARIKLNIGFKTCRRPPGDDSSSGHRFLGASSSSGSSDSSGTYDEGICESNLFRLFLICGALLCIYMVTTAYVARLYRIRMFRRLGVNNAKDSIEFLKFVQRDELGREEAKRRGDNINLDGSEMTTAQLKRDIQAVLDEDEHGDEEAEFKQLAETLLMITTFVWDLWLSFQLYLRLLWRRMFSRSSTSAKRNNSVTPFILAASNDEAQKKSDSNGKTSESGRQSSSMPEDDVAKKHSANNTFMAHVHRTTTTQVNVNAGLVEPVTDSGKRLSAAVPASELRTPDVTPSVSAGSEDQIITATTESLSSRSSRRSVTRRGSVLTSLRAIHEALGTTDHHAERPGSSAGPTRRASGHHQEALLAFLKSMDVNGNNNQHQPAPFQRLRTTSFDEPAAHDAAAMQGLAPTEQPSPHMEMSLRRHTETSGIMSRRRSSVHLQMNNQVYQSLSLVERFKLHRARTSPSFAAALRRSQKGSSKKNARPSVFERILASFLSIPTRIMALFGAQATPKEEKKAGDVESGPNQTEGTRISEDFRKVYLFSEPVYFFRAVELGIMFNCLYMAFWLSNFITIAKGLTDRADWNVINELALLLPVLIIMPCVSFVCETAALLGGITELNLPVIHQVLIDTEDTDNLLADFRSKLKLRVATVQSHGFDRDEVFQLLFDEIDSDGSGMIDKTEFRGLLRHLKLTYSDDRFKRLFRAINTSGNGSITFDELKQLVHHLDDDDDEANVAAREEEARRKEMMSQSNLKSRMTKMGSYPDSRRSTTDMSSPTSRANSLGTIAEMKNGRDDLRNGGRIALPAIPSATRIDEDDSDSSSGSEDGGVVSFKRNKSQSRNADHDLVVTEAEDL